MIFFSLQAGDEFRKYVQAISRRSLSLMTNKVQVLNGANFYLSAHFLYTAFEIGIVKQRDNCSSSSHAGRRHACGLTSNTQPRQRPEDDGKKQSIVALLMIPFSHFCHLRSWWHFLYEAFTGRQTGSKFIK